MKIQKINLGNKALLWAFCAVIMLTAGSVSAYSVDVLPNATDSDQFVVGPGKTEFILDPGERRTIEILVSNLTGDERTFILETEDFGASSDPSQAVELLGAERGPFSLKDYIGFTQKTFILQHGERAHVPITVQAPYDAEPGGLYGAAIVSMYPLPNKNEGSDVSSQTPIVKRIGSLFYVRVTGPVVEDVSLVDFGTNGHKKWFDHAPVDFNLVVENKGSVHAIPKGTVTVNNIFGDTVETIELDSWFVLPGSARIRSVSTSEDFLLGRYTAELDLDLSVDNKESRTVVFWVIPWKLILLLVIILLIIWGSLRWAIKNFQIKRKV